MQLADAQMKDLLAKLRAMTGDHVVKAIIIGIVLYAAYFAGLILVVSLENVVVKLLLAISLSFVVGQLVVAGHDAGHNSLSSNRALNRWFGLIMLLPSLQPYSLWVHHHNLVHHRYVAQLGKDNAFPPLTPAQYFALSPLRRAYYRFIRSLFGQHFWYFLEILIPRMVFPFLDRETAQSRRNVYDTLIIYVWFALTMAFCMAVSASAHPDAGVFYHVVNAFVFGILLPVFFWTTHITFLSIFQHTAPDVKWKIPDGKPSSHEDMMAGTVHVIFPDSLDLLFLRILQHQAHHLNVHIDLHSLKDAQETVALANERRLTRRWTPAYHAEVTRRCKLYDPAEHRWLTFAQAETARPSA